MPQRIAAGVATPKPPATIQLWSEHDLSAPPMSSNTRVAMLPATAVRGRRLHPFSRGVDSAVLRRQTVGPGGGQSPPH